MTTNLTGRSVLVTGADGFIGSHLTERLIHDGAQVRALCVYNSNGSHGWLDGLDAELRSSVDLRLGDIRDSGFIQDLVDGVETTFHLASLIAIPYSYVAPRSYIETNVGGTLNVLDAIRRTGGRMIQTSTSEVYGTPESVPITESHALRAQSPYAASKISADKLCESYAASFETDVQILRPFNTYGPRQSARAVLTTILSQLFGECPDVRLGSLDPRRDLTYVSDTVDGFVRMAETELAPGMVVQLGTGSTISIGELVQLCCEVTGREVEVVSEDERVRPAASEVQVLLSDPSFAAETIGWTPTVDLRTGIERTAAWLQEQPEVPDASRFFM